MPIKTRVFICYRQVDGKDAAGWLYRELHGQTHPLVGHGSDDTQQLDVYFDQAAPALSDWQALHRPSLEAAHAMLVVCTPGMFSRLGPDDWVHMEIDWWLQNRHTAPILIDTTDEGTRWIPPATSRAVRIFKTYGQEAITVVQENPYRLARDIRGIGFLSADTIAQKVGIALDSPLRAQAGVSYALAEASAKGHCGLPHAELVPLAVELLKIPTQLYGMVLLMCGLAYYLLSRALIAHGGAHSALARATGKDRKGILSLLLYLVAIALAAFFHPTAAMGVYVLVAAIWFIPDRRIEHVLGSSGAES